MENMRRFSRLGLVLSVPVLVVVIAVGWYLLSPLFIDQQVEEAFPVVTVATMPATTADAAATEVVTASAAAEDVTAPTPTAEATRVTVAVTESEPVHLLGGMFVDADAVHRGMGEAAIYELADGQRALRFGEFRGDERLISMSICRHPASRSGDQLQRDGDS
ncbi:MAG: hypothetical protein R2856_25190 [Caldilineaceae bacterium]